MKCQRTWSWSRQWNLKILRPSFYKRRVPSVVSRPNIVNLREEPPAGFTAWTWERLFIIFTLHCDVSKNNQSRSMMHLCSCNVLSSSGEDTPVQTPLIPHEALYPCFICLSFHVQLFIIPQPSDMWSCQQDTININEWFLPALSSRTGVLHLKAFSSLWRLSFRARVTLAFGRPRWSILANNTGDKWVGLYSLYSRLKAASITCKHFGADCCCKKKNRNLKETVIYYSATTAKQLGRVGVKPD